MNSHETIKATLTNMKIDSTQLSYKPSEAELKKLIHKYDTIFTGGKYNKVLSIEVAHFLNIRNDEFNSRISKVAFELGMGLEGLHKVASSEPDSTDAYYINLF